MPSGGCVTAAPVLRVGGFVPFSGIDFPGRLSAVAFLQGCPWRCGYCHNPHLQSRQEAAGPAWADVVAFLRRRAGLLDAIVFSGGEPTLDRALAPAMREARALGLQIGLHSAGMYPRRLAELLPLVDWVGLDVKAPLDSPPLHDRVTGVAGGHLPVSASVQALLRSGVAHEFRTTAHPELLDDGALLRIGSVLADMGARAFAVQLARPVREAPAPLAPIGAAYPSLATLDELSRMFPHFVLRRG